MLLSAMGHGGQCGGDLPDSGSRKQQTRATALGAGRGGQHGGLLKSPPEWGWSPSWPLRVCVTSLSLHFFLGKLMDDSPSSPGSWGVGEDDICLAQS
jgi:hypothetical protein